MKIWGSSSITLNKVCAANQCKLCRDRVAMNQCGDPKLHLIYMETDTYLPLSWVKTIHFRKKGAPNPNFAAANITLTNGKCIDTLIMVREEMLPLIICGENDLGTISCLPIYKVKTITFK